MYYNRNVRVARKAKDEIARKFVALIRTGPNFTLACSAGTTAARCVGRLVEAGNYHVIVTNNLGVFDQLRGSDITSIVFTGGEYRPSIRACVGHTAVQAFKEVRCEAALIGASGINAKGELFVRHCEEVPVFKQIVKSATRSVFIVAHASKLVQEDAWWFVSIPQLRMDNPELEICLVTNSCESLEKDKEHAQRVVKALKKMGVKVEGAD
ncbi:MAG: DeoR/GlpR family DNA-binding transcription regulator [Planctomycetota bacterium]